MNPKTVAFQSVVADQLEHFPHIRFKKMFGGFGIYSGNIFFGLIHSEKLYFHTNPRTRKKYEALGSNWFVAPGSKRPLKSYFEVPSAIVENSEELAALAKEALASVE